MRSVSALGTPRRPLWICGRGAALIRYAVRMRAAADLDICTLMHLLWCACHACACVHCCLQWSQCPAPPMNVLAHVLTGVDGTRCTLIQAKRHLKGEDTSSATPALASAHAPVAAQRADASASLLLANVGSSIAAPLHHRSSAPAGLPTQPPPLQPQPIARTRSKRRAALKDSYRRAIAMKASERRRVSGWGGARLGAGRPRNGANKSALPATSTESGASSTAWAELAVRRLELASKLLFFERDGGARNRLLRITAALQVMVDWSWSPSTACASLGHTWRVRKHVVHFIRHGELKEDHRHPPPHMSLLAMEDVKSDFTSWFTAAFVSQCAQPHFPLYCGGRARDTVTKRTQFIIGKKRTAFDRAPPPLCGRLAAKYLNDELLPTYIGPAVRTAETEAAVRADAKGLTGDAKESFVKAAVAKIPQPRICVKTARRWLRTCGFTWFGTRKAGQVGPLPLPLCPT